MGLWDSNGKETENEKNIIRQRFLSPEKKNWLKIKAYVTDSITFEGVYAVGVKKQKEMNYEQL